MDRLAIGPQDGILPYKDPQAEACATFYLQNLFTSCAAVETDTHYEVAAFVA